LAKGWLTMYYTDYISSRIYSVAIYLYISTPISPPLPLTGRTAPNASPAHTALPLPSAARSRPRPLASPAVEAPSPQSPREGRPPPRLPVLPLAAAHRALLRSAPPSCSVGAFEPPTDTAHRPAAHHSVRSAPSSLVALATTSSGFASASSAAGRTIVSRLFSLLER